MKKSLVIFLVIMGAVLLNGYVYASEIEAQSRLANVTVYPDAALISRVAVLKLSPGDYKVAFPDIIPELDENSLRVSASGSAQVKLFGAQLKREFLEDNPAQRIKEIDAEIERLEDKMRELDSLKKILAEEKSFLDSLRVFSAHQLPKDLVTKMPQPAELENLLKFLDAKLKDNFLLVFDSDLRMRDLNKKIETLRRETAQLGGSAKKLKRSIIVDMEVLKPGNLEVMVSFLIRGVTWMPIYDARANFEKSEVEFVSYGVVKQKTGEDWEDVEVSLSTAKPAIGGNMPYVAPWFLRPYQPPRQQAYRGKDKKAMLCEKASVCQDMAFAPESIEEAAIGGAEEEYARAEEKGIAVVYKLPKKTTIRADGTDHKLAISAQILSAKFEYSTYPRSVLIAYLGSRVTNSPNLQLLGGRVNIFLEGDFVGISHISNIAPGEEFDLYLGADENVKVKRELVEKKVDETLIANIPSANKRTIFKYKITLENYKSKKSKIKLFESMPVSADDRIKVKIEKLAVEPKVKDWQDRKGVWLWEFELEPKAKQELFYSFTVEHPRDMPVEGLQ